MSQADMFQMSPRKISQRKIDMSSHEFDEWAMNTLSSLNKEASCKPDFWQETPQELYRYRLKAINHFTTNYQEVRNEQRR